MFKEFFQTTTAILRVAQDVAESQEEIRVIRRELGEVTSTVQRLQLELRHVSEREARERQLIVFQLENMLLRRREVPGLPEPADEP